MPREQPIERSGLERIYGANSYREILDTKIPQTTIPVAPGRNLAVLVEAAVRNHVLKTKGIDPAQTFSIAAPDAAAGAVVSAWHPPQTIPPHPPPA